MSPTARSPRPPAQHAPFERGRLDLDALHLDRALQVVDSHTAGQPTRVILDGVPRTDGPTAAQHRDQLRSRHDWVRTTATLEPRGHRSIMSVALIEPSRRNPRWGAVFMDADGYPDMCGHATIGAATTLVRLGLLPVPKPDFDGRLPAVLDTPAGAVELDVEVREGTPRSVSITLPLAFMLAQLHVSTSLGATTAQVAYAGQWYAFVQAADFGLAVAPDRVDALIAHSPELRASVAARLAVEDPRTRHVPAVGNVVWCSAPAAAPADARHMPVSAAGAFDRSPCGTATCARLAILHATRALRDGATFVNEGVLGTRYTARVVRELTLDGAHGIVPQLQGSAHLTGRALLGVDRDDPLAGGFAIGAGPAIVNTKEMI
ncbi:MAG: proline racemase family protein [Solirubrobacteraceae bacterium]